MGGNGAGASDGGAVSVDNVGNIVTAGIGSYGIMAQSIGGGGGEGGYGGQSASTTGLSSTDLQIVVGGKGGSSGNGGTVTVNNSGYILTTGAGSFGVWHRALGAAAESADTVSRAPWQISPSVVAAAQAATAAM